VREWRDDLELGASELAIAFSSGHVAACLPHSEPSFYLERAATRRFRCSMSTNTSAYSAIPLRLPSVAGGDRSMSASLPTQLVFAYGSLVHDLARQHSAHVGAGPERVSAWHAGQDSAGRTARLRDHRRAWNVAMDNAVSLSGYKYYLDARDSSRPEVAVAFLNLMPAPGHGVNGMLVPVDAAELAELDRREHNYERREVTSSIEQPPDARVWTYFGKPKALERFADGRRAGRAVVDKSYLDRVRTGFAALGGGALAEFDASTDPHGCRVLELLRVDLG